LHSKLIFKAPPYIRLVGEGWPLTRNRAFYESEALKEQANHVPNLVPKLYQYDPQDYTLVMEYLESYIVLRKGLIKGIVYNNLAEHLSDFLSKVLFSTSGLSLKTQQKKQRVALFSGNHEMCKTTEQVIFSDPYVDSPLNRWNQHLDHLVQEIKKDGSLKIAISQLKLKFQDNTEVLPTLFCSH
jgi:5-methylthioribose kinase